MGIPFYNDETNPNYGVYKFKKGFNGEVVTFAGEFYYVFKPFKKKLIDFCERVVMNHRERQRQKLLKNRNKDFGTEQAGQKPAEQAEGSDK